MKKLLSVIVCLFLGVTMMMAQTKTITGRVISGEDGEPIIGASVVVTGTNTGTVTDIDGNFSLKVAENAKTVTVSFVGMEKQTVSIKKNMTIELSPNNEVLDEVMVVAFGTQKKESFTGAAAVVKSEDLAKHVATNVTSSLAGTVPGLQLRGGSGAPGSSGGSINIRGVSSLFAGTDPLVIVDGATYPASLSNIPQDDIESVTVLKDAVSAALYGARGANGVILITTKKGKTKDAQIRVDAKWGAQTRAVAEYDVITDPAEFYEMYYNQVYNYAYYGQGMSSEAANKWSNERMLADLHYNIYTLPEGQSLIGMDGKLNPQAKMGSVYTAPDGSQYWLQADDWRDEAFHTALRQEYTVSTNGLTDRGSFYASVGYLDEDGIIDYSGYQRITARFKTDYQARKWLKVGINVGYTNSKTTSNPNIGTSGNSTNLSYYTNNIPPIYPIYVRTYNNGEIAIKTNETTGHPEYDYGTTGAAYTGYPGLSRPFSQTGNPLGTNRYNRSWTKGQQFNATATADIDFTSFLKMNITSNVNWGHSNGTSYDTMFEGPKQGVRGELGKSQNDVLRTNNTQTLTYTDTYADKHNVNVLVGHEYYKTETKYLYAYAQGLFTEEILELNAAADHSGRANSYTSSNNTEGFFGQALYNYDERYYGQFTYRRDGSSYFSKDNRWGNFWGVGASWVLSKESFMDDVEWLEYAKLRYSFGQQGNDNIGSFRYTDTYSLGTTMSPTFASLGNPGITWETVTKQNFGLEFSFFKNRLSGSLDVYHEKTTDLLFWLSIPESSGSRGYYGNVGDLKNVGFELALNGSLYRARNIDVSLSANIAHNKSEILSLPESKIRENGGFASDGSAYWYEVGGSLHQGYRKSYAGVDEYGQAMYWMDSSLNGSTAKPGSVKDKKTYNPNEASYYRQGTYTPDFFGGFALNVKLWDFDLSATFDYQIGGKGYDARYASLMSPDSDMNNSYIYNRHKDWEKAWSPNNTESNIPRWQYLDQYSVATCDRFLTNASYLNFQSFMVGYNVPKKVLNHMGLSGLRLYVSGENLCYWSARKGFDPRQGYSGNSSVTAYPSTRTILGGVQVSF